MAQSTNRTQLIIGIIIGVIIGMIFGSIITGLIKIVIFAVIIGAAALFLYGVIKKPTPKSPGRY